MRRQSFYRSKAQIAFPALDPTQVGAVDPEHLGQSFLAEIARFSYASDVSAQRALQVAFHSQRDGAAVATDRSTDL